MTVRIAAFCLLTCLVSVDARAQEFQFFTSVVGAVSGTAGWDSFSPAEPNNYVGPHSPDVLELGLSGSSVSVTPGGFRAGPNLYAFFSTPTWTINAGGASTALPFTSIALQIATTPPNGSPDLNAGSFLLNGLAPDEFIEFGQLSTLGAGGGQPAQPVNYFWASWNGLLASSNYTFSVGPGGNHAVFTAARVDYVNTTDSTFRIRAIPEPSLGIVALGGLLFGWAQRRR